MINWLTVLIGFVGLYIGYKLNQYANEQSERRIIDALIAEIKSLKDNQITGRITNEEQQRIMVLEEAIKLIQTKK